MAIAALPPVAPTRPRGDLTDHELVRAVRVGDDEAFEQLYTRYRRRIASYVYGMVQDHARAEDLTQDVFMSALRRMRETERPIAFKPWIYEIAKNACIDQFRRSRRAEEVSYDADDALGSADHGRLAARGPSPDLAVEHKQQLDNLRGAFGGLSEAHHEILVMRELEGLSYREIGERLGMTRPSVESTLFRARRRLTEEYAELETGVRCMRIQGLLHDAAGGPLGARDARKLGRHLPHCRACRRHASSAGLDVAALIERGNRVRLAALLPLPAFLRKRFDGDGVSPLASSPNLVQWGTAVSHYAEPGIAGWAKAAAAAVTLAAAGTGINIVGSDQGLRFAGGSESVLLGHDHADRSSSKGAARSTPAPPVATVAPGLPARQGSGSGSGGRSGEGKAGKGGSSSGPNGGPVLPNTPKAPVEPPALSTVLEPESAPPVRLESGSNRAPLRNLRRATRTRGGPVRDARRVVRKSGEASTGMRLQAPVTPAQVADPARDAVRQADRGVGQASGTVDDVIGG